MTSPRGDIDRLVASLGRWLEGTGPRAGIVLSSRVRVARNIDGAPFPHRADAAARTAVLTRVVEAADRTRFLQGFLRFEMEDLSSLDRHILFERHLVSREFLEGEGRVLLVDPTETVAVMVNEEDHLRFQALSSGLQTVETWRILRSIEREMDALVPFAFDRAHGYLSACPTNLGTGLRASALLHLPALAWTRRMKEILRESEAMDLTIRGFFGEGTEALGNLFQVSNRATLGRAEDEIVEAIERAVLVLVGREEEARVDLRARERLALEDRAWRAWGTARCARAITTKEAMTLLSAIRLGAETGILPDAEAAALNEILVFAQPAHLQRAAGRSLPGSARDEARARYIRNRLGAE